MGLSMAGIALMSEFLVALEEAAIDALPLTPFFVSIIIVLIGVACLESAISGNTPPGCRERHKTEGRGN